MSDTSQDLTREQAQPVLDREHVRLLSLGYLVMAWVSLVTSLIGLFYILIGLPVVLSYQDMSEADLARFHTPPLREGLIVLFVGSVIFLVLILMAILQFRASRCLKEHRSRRFCQVVAGVSCLKVPYGTVVGVLTFLVLGRESVKEMLAASPSPPAVVTAGVNGEGDTK